MASIVKRRMTAGMEGDFVVFLIGMRINRIWKVWKWFPVLLAMPRMLKELQADPESGYLGAEQYIRWRSPVVIQYWRSFEHLERYSRAKDGEHFPAWVKFNQRVSSNGDVGIWHETYSIAAGQYECVYNNMPLHGLGRASTAIPATGRHATAAGRLGVREEAGYPEEAPLPGV